MNFLEICFLISHQFASMHEAHVSFYRKVKLFVAENKIFSHECRNLKRCILPISPAECSANYTLEFCPHSAKFK